MRAGRRAVRGFGRLPGAIQVVGVLIIVVTLGAALNWMVQVARKPAELLFPVSDALAKTPAQTWRHYAPIFRRHATPAISPELLAALAQAEGAGNPLARTYWRWSWGRGPFEIYRPASSSVGMYQMTDGTFDEARHYCVRNHRVVAEGAWNDWQSCWFNGFYTRVLPGDAVELTSAYLDLQATRTLARHRVATATRRQRQHLAAVIHLCGAGAGDLYVGNGFQFAAGQRCGDHDPRLYLARVDALTAAFARLAAHD